MSDGTGPWKVDTVRLGRIPSLPLSNFIPESGSCDCLDVECLSFLLSSPYGTVLVDSGPDPRVAATYGYRVVGAPDRPFDESLARRGRIASNVDAVIHTHLHYDHMQNDGLFEHAEIVVNRRELGFAQSSGPEHFYLAVDDFVEEFGDRLRLIDEETELFPGLSVVPTGGHTPGHQAVVVETRRGAICLAGDEMPLAINALVAAGNCIDRLATASFLTRARRRGWALVPSHDPHLAQIASLTDLDFHFSERQDQ